ncbi:uncharacterized membrane protein YhaH (DUF805 family) [Rhizomicrobium palustre]|uniref:Uncharacterized membrane protein YhaH (DUF805 family) n=1 Tax=Rhizomicrobium palustre TaxID=189966 RepID=A0A846MX92_9PROT|nr:DUF805 domain-containing protein [Rhizomicrobium palustre]NIK87859.1 uncharacterized membrane protein YhaH (DUF805 family) [Rhizomicrobium palustre]
MLGFLFSFRGRASRADIWKFTIAGIVLVLVLRGSFATIRDADVFAQAPEILSHAPTADKLLLLSILLTFCVITLAGLAVTTRRLHDREKSAWWLIPFWALPELARLLFPGGLSAHTPYGWFGVLVTLISFGLSFWAFLELLCFGGSIGENEYGPDPLPRPVINPFAGEPAQ